MTTPEANRTKPLISPWYRRALVVVSVAVVLVGLLAGASFRQATIQACQGSNEAKAATTKIIDTLFAASQVPSANPDIQKARDENAARYLLLQQKFHIILTPDDCGSLVPWDA